MLVLALAQHVTQTVIRVPVIFIAPLALALIYTMDFAINLAQVEPMRLEENVLHVHKIVTAAQVHSLASNAAPGFYMMATV